MHVDDIFALAQHVHALLPSARVAPGEPWDPEEQDAVADRLVQLLVQARQIGDLGAEVLAAAICGTLGGWGGRYGSLDALVEEAKTVLTRQAGGASDPFGVRRVPAGELGAAHIACLLDWWLCRDEHDPDPGP